MEEHKLIYKNKGGPVGNVTIAKKGDKSKMYSLLNFTVIGITLFQLSLDSEYNNQLCIVLPKEIITQEQQQKSERRSQSEPLNSPKTIVRENRKKFAT